jgi:hypothetical protein
LDKRKMKNQETIDLHALAALALAAAFAMLNPAEAQLAPPAVATVQPGQGPVCAACAVVREIDDPHTGQQWLLMRNPANPGGPGILVFRKSIPEDSRLEGAIVRLHPVIHAGDKITVEQSNAKFDLWMEGVALSPAALGVPLRVRLVLSGKVVEALALGPGRAVRIPEKEFWP